MNKKKNLFAFAGAVLVIVGIVLYVIFVPTSSLTRVEGELNSRQEARLLREISALIVVPQDEEPVVAYVTNAPQLRMEQPFYAGVKNGDFVVLFPISQKAVVYDPVAKILINVGPVQVNDAIQPPLTTEEGEIQNNQEIVTPEIQTEEEVLFESNSSESEGDSVSSEESTTSSE